VVSPWSKGGWVSSELFDHTSVIRFLEARFGVMEPNIGPWRRAVCGDLTSAFDFVGAGDGTMPALPDVSMAGAVVAVQSKLPVPAPPVESEKLFQEPGTRPSRPLPYDLHVDGTGGGERLSLTFGNNGKRAAVFQVYDRLHLDRIPRRYTVEPGKSLAGSWAAAAADSGRYDLEVHGPGGFLRRLSGPAAASAGLELMLRHDAEHGAVVLTAINKGSTPRTVTVRAEAYRTDGPWTLAVTPGGTAEQHWQLADSGNWYDLTATDGDFHRRFSGRVETGKPAISDPRMGV